MNIEKKEVCQNGGFPFFVFNPLRQPPAERVVKNA